MKKLNYILFVGLILAGLKIGANAADPQSWNFTEVTAASATVFSGGGYFGGIYLTSGTETSAGANWAIVMDTFAVAANSYANFASANKKSPPLVFQSTASYVQNGGGYQNSFVVPGDHQIYISSGCFLYKTAASSGEAHKVGVLWHK